MTCCCYRSRFRFGTLQKHCFQLTQFSGREKEVRSFHSAPSTVKPFPLCAFVPWSSGCRRTEVLVYKQASSYFPILGHSCSIQQSAGCHVRAGNAGFIIKGEGGPGASPALWDDDDKRSSSAGGEGGLRAGCLLRVGIKTRYHRLWPEQTWWLL